MKKITLNPEIKNQADKLFLMIEKEVEKHHEDDVAYAMAEEWKNYLKTSKGFDMLEYARDLTLTESERSRFSLEEVFNKMDDESAQLLTDLVKWVKRIADDWGGVKKIDPEVAHRINFNLKEAKETADKIDSEISGLWMYRAMAYRQEIGSIKKAS